MGAGDLGAGTRGPGSRGGPGPRPGPPPSPSQPRALSCQWPFGPDEAAGLTLIERPRLAGHLQVEPQAARACGTFRAAPVVTAEHARGQPAIEVGSAPPRDDIRKLHNAAGWLIESTSVDGSRHLLL